MIYAPFLPRRGVRLDISSTGCKGASIRTNIVGQGVREIRVQDADSIFRAIYAAKYADAVYVLHCFQKKTQKTSRADVELAKRRYWELVKELGR